MAHPSKPRVTGSSHPLPFAELSARDFERLCLWLVRREGFDPADLSALTHGDTDQGGMIAAAVLPAFRGLDDDRGRFYYDLVYNSLNEATRRALGETMKGYEYQSDFARKYVAQGRAEEAARALLMVLRARSISVPDTVRERILAEKDPERLERWLEKAATATSVAAVLDEPN